MHRIFIFTLGIVLIISRGADASSIGYAKVAAGSTVAHVVTVDLSDPEVKMTVALARGGVGKSEPFKSIVGRTRPVAAITGTFYDTKTYVPTGDIALFGTVVHAGCVGSALCIDASNKASIAPPRGTCKDRWAGYETVLCAGPTLIAGGRVAIALKHEGFRRSLLASTRRTAVGITHSGKLLLVAVNRKASLYAVAKLMLKLGVVDALSLDGGSSTGFYSQGNYLAVPSRKMTNCLMVYSNARAYQTAKAELAPAKLFAKADSPILALGLTLPDGALLPPYDQTRPMLEARQ